MTKKEENQLVKLLNKLFKKVWNFNWNSQDNGFQLILQVYKKTTNKRVKK